MKNIYPGDCFVSPYHIEDARVSTDPFLLLPPRALAARDGEYWSDHRRFWADVPSGETHQESKAAGSNGS